MSPLGVLLLACQILSAQPEPALASQPRTPLQIQSVLVAGKTNRWSPGGALRLGWSPELVSFNFGPSAGAGWQPTRLRYKLEGYDSAWKEGQGAMGLTVHFSDEHGDQVGQATYEATGQSAGWNGTLTNSTLSHRRESLIVPASAYRVWVTISSGIGPPGTAGIYLVQDPVISRLAANNETREVLLRPVFLPDSPNAPPRNWVRDGIRPSMARIVELCRDPTDQAFAIVDDDPAGHAEWHNLRETAPRVSAGDRLVLEWNELFSMGQAATRSATYTKLPAGDFRFIVQALTTLGAPTGIEDSLRVHVPVPVWSTPFFWPAALTAVLGVSLGTTRYLAWYRMRRELALLRQQRALEQERLRIAQDIHDDLGARVTQIALLSGIAQDNVTLPENARAEFSQVSRLTRDLISALYETVWAVNPENDNLDALGGYLCQMVNDLCNQARLRCRLEVMELPRHIQVSSQTRHNISMAVKEAVHNIIKHAQAAEVTLRAGLEGTVLTISVHDDGCGYAASTEAGNGLRNMQQRLADVGGTCAFRSVLGKETTVEMTMRISPLRPL